MIFFLTKGPGYSQTPYSLPSIPKNEGFCFYFGYSSDELEVIG